MKLWAWSILGDFHECSIFPFCRKAKHCLSWTTRQISTSSSGEWGSFYFEANKPSLIDSGTVEEVIGSVGGEIRAQRSRLETFFHPISVINWTSSCSSGASFLKDLQSNSKVAAKIVIRHHDCHYLSIKWVMCSWTWGWFFSTEICELGVLVTQWPY
jgi:hypothetical protein